MKAFLFTLLFAVSTWAASAQNYNYLMLQQNDGTQQALAISGLKITFSDGNLVASNGSTTATIALSDMRKMYFATDATGIAQVATDEAPSISIVGGKLHVNAPASSQVQVFSIDGRKLSTDATLTKGVYVVRVGNQSFKVMAQ